MIDMKSILNQSIGIKFMCIVALSNKASLVIGQAAVTFEAISINKRFGVEYVCVCVDVFLEWFCVSSIYTLENGSNCVHTTISSEKSKTYRGYVQWFYSQYSVTLQLIFIVWKK